MRIRISIAVIVMALSSCGFFGEKVDQTFASVGFKPELAEFKSDGCTLFPDQSQSADWCRCCTAHDLAYWQGGSEDERLVADQKLRACVLAETKSVELAELVFDGVRIGGLPILPTWYRWGYGWNYLRPAKPLSSKEQLMVRQRLKEYRRAGSPVPCP